MYVKQPIGTIFRNVRRKLRKVKFFLPRVYFFFSVTAFLCIVLIFFSFRFHQLHQISLMLEILNGRRGTGTVRVNLTEQILVKFIHVRRYLLIDYWHDINPFSTSGLSTAPKMCPVLVRSIK